MTTIKNVTEGKKELRSLIGFLSTNKIDNYNRAGRKGEKRRRARGGEKKRKRKQKEKIQKNLQNKSKHKNNKCFS